MRRPLGAKSRAASIGSAVALMAIALAGCGNAASGGAGPSGSEVAVKKPATISLTSAAINGGKLPARYACDGANKFPTFKWGKIPTRATEVVLFALDVTSSGSSIGSSSVEWAMAGVNPRLHSLMASRLPAGAFLVPNSNGTKGYSICPPKGKTRRYEFAVYAMPPPYTVGTTITGSKLLENLTEGPPQYRAVGQGALFATYRRG